MFYFKLFHSFFQIENLINAGLGDYTADVEFFRMDGGCFFGYFRPVEFKCLNLNFFLLALG